MPNFLEMMRMRNVFGQPPTDNPSLFGNIDFGGSQPIVPEATPAPVESPVAPVPQVQSPADMVRSRMQEIYSPETEATERFNEMLQAYPTYKEPSGLRKVGGAILGALTDLGTNFGGNRTRISGTDVFNETIGRNQYERDIADWKNRITPAQQAANIERQSNVNERSLAYQTVSAELRAEADAERARNNDKKAAIAQQRADIYGFKARNPALKFNFSGPTIQVADPSNGEVVDTGIPTGILSDADKLALQHTNRLTEIAARGDEARETENLRQTGREGVAETRGWTLGTIPDPNNPSKQIGVRINEVTGETIPITFGGQTVTGINRPTASGGRGELPTQTRVRQFNAARELANSNPELAKWITLGKPGSNDFEITPPGENWFGTPSGPSPEEYNQIISAIYGDTGTGDIELPSDEGTMDDELTTPSPLAPTTATQPTLPPGAIIPQGRVAIAKDGQVVGSIPESQIAQAEAQGYTVVR